MIIALHTLAIALCFIGAVFLLVAVVGLFNNEGQSLIAIDQWLACCLLPDSYADETISAWAHRTHHTRIERFINWIFDNPYHCATAYVSEMNGSQNAKEYK